MDDLLKNNIGLQVLTDTGWSNFAGLLLRGSKQTLLIKTTTHNIVCTLDHKFYKPNLEFVEAGSLRPRHKIRCSDKIDTVVSVTLAKIEPVYDLLEVEKNHRFYANDILVKNCEFLIYDETLINASTLLDLEPSNPIEKQGQIRWFSKPKKGCTYMIGLDPSLGTGGDFAALQVVELPSCRQVAEWQHNRTPIPGQIYVLKEICNYLYEQIGTETDIYYSVENNTIGEAALIAIAEVGEENIRGVFLSEPARVGQARRYRKGFTTTNKSKITACVKFKSMVEHKKLFIGSSNLISELKTFVASGGSFAAKIGETDDLVMSMLLVIRMLSILQNYDPTLDNHLKDMNDETMMPMPFIMF